MSIKSIVFSFLIVIGLSGCSTFGAVLKGRDQTAINAYVADYVKNQQDINKKDALGRTALELAMQHSNREAIRDLIKAGADMAPINSENKQYYDSVANSAIVHGDIEVMSFLMKHGFDINQPRAYRDDIVKESLYYSHRPDFLIWMLKNGLDINTIKDSNEWLSYPLAIGNDKIFTWNKEELLYFSLGHEGWEVIADALLSKGVSANSFLGQGPVNSWTPEKLEYLLGNKSIDLNYQDSTMKTTALHRAAWAGRKDIVEYLLSKNVETRIVNHAGLRAVDVAAQTGNSELTLKILDGMKALTQRDLLFVLYYAGDKVSVYEAVLGKYKEFDINTKDAVGKTLLQFAIQNKWDSVQSFLLGRKDVSVTLADDQGLSPLHLIGKETTKESIGRLLDLGADRFALDKLYKSPLYYAFEADNAYAITTLICHGVTDEVEFNKGLMKLWGIFNDYCLRQWPYSKDEYDAAIALLKYTGDIESRFASTCAWTKSAIAIAKRNGLSFQDAQQDMQSIRSIVDSVYRDYFDKTKTYLAQVNRTGTKGKVFYKDDKGKEVAIKDVFVMKDLIASFEVDIIGFAFDSADSAP